MTHCVVLDRRCGDARALLCTAITIKSTARFSASSMIPGGTGPKNSNQIYPRMRGFIRQQAYELLPRSGKTPSDSLDRELVIGGDHMQKGHIGPDRVPQAHASDCRNRAHPAQGRHVRTVLWTPPEHAAQRSVPDIARGESVPPPQTALLAFCLLPRRGCPQQPGLFHTSRRPVTPPSERFLVPEAKCKYTLKRANTSRQVAHPHLSPSGKKDQMRL